MTERSGPAYVAELIGTFFLVLAICLVASVTTAAEGLTPAALVAIALAHAIVLATMVYAVGGTSGAHLNPAVTSTLLALGKITPPRAGVYIVMQLIGAVAAALVCKILLGDFGEAANYGAPGVSDVAAGDGAGFLAEMLGTFILLWAIVAMAVNVRAEKAVAGLIIGLALGLGVLMMGALTGAALNPARAFGPALVSGEFGGAGTFLLVYVLAPVVGGALAGLLYSRLVLDEQERRWGGRLVDADVPPGQLEGEVRAAERGPGERPVDKLS
ncbi:MAG TPA: aquaporin [Capillimicrobium sp.]|jgi:MIP family channel proteins